MMAGIMSNSFGKADQNLPNEHRQYVVKDRCTFCAIAHGRQHAEVVFESADVLAFMDALPMTPGHLLVIPKHHIDDIYAMSHDVGGHLLTACSVMANRLVTNLGALGVNVLNNNGHAADQSQFHIHFHVIPRYGDDRLLHPWERRFGDWPQIRNVAEKIRS
jgi:histidine triad (HIT) family protein